MASPTGQVEAPTPGGEAQAGGTTQETSEADEEEEEQEEEEEEEGDMKPFEPKPLTPVTNLTAKSILDDIFKAMEDHGFRLEIKVGDQTIQPTKDMLTIVVTKMIEGIAKNAIIAQGSFTATVTALGTPAPVVGTTQLQLP